MIRKKSAQDLLELWQAYGDEEKIFFHDPLENKTIIAAIAGQEVHTDFSFYAFDFFDFFNNEDHKACFAQAALSFRDYCIVQNNNILAERLNPRLEVRKISKVSHDFQMIREDYQSWEHTFSQAIEHLKNKELQKIVLSQKIELNTKDEFHQTAIILNLLEQNPASFIFAYHKKGKTFLGASPEILVAKQGTNISSFALAGTIAKDGKNNLALGQKLLQDQKNIQEHLIVVKNIQDEISKLSSNIQIGTIELMELPNLFHLKTWIRAKSTKPLLDFVKTMHPSPALGGYPKNLAMGMIKKYEKHEREHYGAPFGYVNNNGDGVFLVGIRSAYVEKNKITAFAGCGIVEKSNAMEEYLEVENKLKTILDAI